MQNHNKNKILLYAFKIHIAQKLLSSLIEQRKVNAQNDVNNTKIGINDNEKKKYKAK